MQTLGSDPKTMILYRHIGVMVEIQLLPEELRQPVSFRVLSNAFRARITTDSVGYSVELAAAPRPPPLGHTWALPRVHLDPS